MPNILQGVGVMAYALAAMGWQFDLVRALLFLGVFACGCAMAYSFLLMLSSLSVWLVRNQSLMEMWWLFTTLMRYPREIFTGTRATRLGWWAVPTAGFFTYIVPVLLVVNVPAQTLVRTLDPRFVAWMVVASVALLWASRWFFRRALRAYRSASS
jgi:ABC-2 type transport system permease protein